MENTEASVKPEELKQEPKWFQSPWISRGTLLIAGLFFLLPFININCSGTKLASIRGTDMVFGKELKPRGEEKEILPATDSLSKNLNAVADTLAADVNALVQEKNPFSFANDLMGEEKTKNIEPNALAIFAFVAIFIALIFSFLKKKAFVVTSGVFSIASALSLFFIQVQISSEIQKQLGPMNFIPITFEFTSYYWLCLLFLVIASVFSFVRRAVKT